MEHVRHVVEFSHSSQFYGQRMHLPSTGVIGLSGGHVSQVFGFPGIQVWQELSHEHFSGSLDSTSLLFEHII